MSVPYIYMKVKGTRVDVAPAPYPLCEGYEAWMREMRYSDVSLNHAVQALPLIVAAANKDMSYAQLMKSQFKVQPVQLKRLHKFAEHSASEDCMPSRVRIWLRKIKEDLPL